MFTAASKAITIRVSSEDEDEDTKVPPIFQAHSSLIHAFVQASHTDLRRTTTGIISNRRPVSGTPASTSGSTTPTPTADVSLSLLATAKREAAKRGLYARFFRGPVLGPDDDPCKRDASDAGPSSPARASEQDRISGDTKKRKPDGDAETKEERREQKRLKKERKAARAAKRAEKALAREEEKSRLDVVDQKEWKTRSGEDDTSSKTTRNQTRKSLPEFAPTHNEQQDTVPSHNDTTELNIVLTTKKKKGKRKDTP